MRAYGTVTSDCLRGAETIVVKAKVLLFKWCFAHFISYGALPHYLSLLPFYCKIVVCFRKLSNSLVTHNAHFLESLGVSENTGAIRCPWRRLSTCKYILQF